MNYPDHFQVDSVTEAVALAEALRAADEYNIFRGQTVDWPMRASFLRLDPAQQEAAQERFLEFAAFVERTPELQALQGDRFGVMAIAQHYGIPTVLVDFTTEPSVAGWFASHGKPSAEGRPGIIYLAHEEYIEQQYRDCLPELHTLRIAVDNLWRLQAQSGLFLHLPFKNDPELDKWLADAFGSIRFPYRGPLDTIPETAIYPVRKSRLEVLFDGFLADENLRHIHDQLATQNVRTFVMPDFRASGYAPSFVGDKIPPLHDSWAPERTVRWMRPPAEVFPRRENPPEIVLAVAPEMLKSTEPRRLQEQFAATIRAFVAAQPNPRAGFVDFHLRLSGSAAPLDNCVCRESGLGRTVRQDLEDCWDGMRIFPYPDAVLCDAVAYLAAAWAQVHGGGKSLYQSLEDLLGDNLLIEFGLADRAQHAVAPVPPQELVAALREDLLDFLKPEFHSWRTQPAHLCLHVNQPQRLFDFGRFMTVFGCRCVPGQFLVRQRPVVLFSPAGIERLAER